MTDTLTRWGDIALYLKVSEKTAMRYHKKRGLPEGELKLNKLRSNS